MALIPKSDLLRTVRTLSSFDPTASPYVAIQLGETPTFYRSGSMGFIQSINIGIGKLTYVSLSHLRDCLQVLRDESVDLFLDSNGILCIRSTDHTYDSELHVHTVRLDQAGAKYHSVGTPIQTLDASLFEGFDVKSFTFAAPPSLVDGRIMIPTTMGIVIWSGPDFLKTIKLQPRESLLRFLSAPLTHVCITDGGYWGATSAELMSFVSGHDGGTQLYKTYAVVSTPLAKFPTSRLLYALGAAANLCNDNGKIDICPNNGVTTRDTTGNQAKFTLGAQTGWTKFSIAAKSAKLIVAALSQTKDENTVLSTVPLAQPTLRFTAGQWEVNTKVF